MPDIEIIALSCMIEDLSISSENWLFGKLKFDYSAHFPNLIPSSRFNIRRRGLQFYINEVCLSIAGQVGENHDAIIIDSIPLPVCANPRISRSKGCKDDP